MVTSNFPQDDGLYIVVYRYSSVAYKLYNCGEAGCNCLLLQAWLRRIMDRESTKKALEICGMTQRYVRSVQIARAGATRCDLAPPAELHWGLVCLP